MSGAILTTGALSSYPRIRSPSGHRGRNGLQRAPQGASHLRHHWSITTDGGGEVIRWTHEGTDATRRPGERPASAHHRGLQAEFIWALLGPHSAAGRGTSCRSSIRRGSVTATDSWFVRAAAVSMGRSSALLTARPNPPTSPSARRRVHHGRRLSNGRYGAGPRDDQREPSPRRPSESEDELTPRAASSIALPICAALRQSVFGLETALEQSCRNDSAALQD